MTDDLKIFRGGDYEINSKITLHQPTLGEISDYGEKEYFGLVRSICSTPADHKVDIYENLGIYSMIAQIDNPHFMTEYVKNTLGPLIKADQMQEGSLLGTLEAYLRNNCNANATAESLFIHKNTLRYRMDKIRRILDRDLDHIDQFLELELAFAILHYQENQNS